MKQHIIGIFTTVCLTVSLFMFLGSPNLNEKIDIDLNSLIEKCPIGVNPQDSNNACGSNMLVLVGQDSILDDSDNGTNWLDVEIYLEIPLKVFLLLSNFSKISFVIFFI